MQNRKTLEPVVRAQVDLAIAMSTPLPGCLTPREGYEELEGFVRAALEYDFSEVDRYVLENSIVLPTRHLTLSADEIEPSRNAMIAMIAIASLPEYVGQALGPTWFADAYAHAALDILVQIGEGENAPTMSLFDHFCQTTLGKPVAHLTYERRPTTTRLCDVVGIVFTGPFNNRVWSPSDSCEGFMVTDDGGASLPQSV